MLMLNATHYLTSNITHIVISTGNYTIDEIAEQNGISADQVDPGAAKAAVIHGDELKDIDEEALDEIIR
jgi:sodium/potassium-transporting ATPase subunit alpha